MPPNITLAAAIEDFPIAGAFTISRGAKTIARVVVATLSDGRVSGRGECVPYPRYGETPEGVAAAIAALAPQVAGGLDSAALQAAMPPGAARNAIDCAFWDYEAKRQNIPAYMLAGLPAPRPLTTAFTISLGDPAAMAADARAAAQRPLLKIKLGGEDDIARIRAVRAAAPSVTLIADANEGWSAANLNENLRACADAHFVMVEQPLPASGDELLAAIERPLPVCADESVHDRASLAALRGKYDAVNIKLDKAGGLTEALAMAREARVLGFRIMAGCMVSSSLAMAPAMLLAQGADIVDLDGPLLLARDRDPALHYDGSVVNPPLPALWG